MNYQTKPAKVCCLFVNWYKHQQHHWGEAIAICIKQTAFLEQARQAKPKRASRKRCYWKHPVLLWINDPLEPLETSLQVNLIRWHNCSQKVYFHYGYFPGGDARIEPMTSTALPLVTREALKVFTQGLWSISLLRK